MACMSWPGTNDSPTLLSALSNSRLFSEFGLAPPEQLSRGPDLLAGDHFAALRDFRRSGRLGRSRSLVRCSTSTRRTASGRDGFGSG
jgi:hypothetical protein